MSNCLKDNKNYNRSAKVQELILPSHGKFIDMISEMLIMGQAERPAARDLLGHTFLHEVIDAPQINDSSDEEDVSDTDAEDYHDGYRRDSRAKDSRGKVRRVCCYVFVLFVLSLLVLSLFVVALFVVSFFVITCHGVVCLVVVCLAGFPWRFLSSDVCLGRGDRRGLTDLLHRVGQALGLFGAGFSFDRGYLSIGVLFRAGFSFGRRFEGSFGSTLVLSAT